MTRDRRDYDDTDVEEMAEIARLERRHRQTTRRLTASGRSLRLLWLVTAFILIGVATVVWMSLR